MQTSLQIRAGLAARPTNIPSTRSWHIFCASVLQLCVLMPLAAHGQTSYTVPGQSYPYPAGNLPNQNPTSNWPSGFQSQSNFFAPQPAPQNPDPITFQTPQVGQDPGIAQFNFPAPGLQPAQPVFTPNQENQPGVLDLNVTVPQSPSGRFSIGGTYGSDNGLVGQIIVDERDFDIRRFPMNFQELGNAFRGGGQHFRLEVVPGNELERYLVSWSDPYFRNTDYSLSLSGYLFDRQYFDWDEERIGLKVGLGRNLTQYLSVNSGLRLESVTINNPRVGTSPQLNANLGNSNLFLGSVGLVYDTREHPYLTGVGSYLAMTYSQAFGDYSYARGDIDFRNHRTIYQRPDASGRHTLEFRTKLGFTGGSTPVFENYLAGGMSSLRGFDFRGISPLEGGVRVGGEFQWLNSLEYKFPLTADDMIHGVMFVDFGTVEESVELNSENFRVAPGVGLRVHLPYAGLGAPLAFDFAFPVSDATGDDKQSFGFLIGVMR